MGTGNGNASANAQPASQQQLADDLRLDPDRRRKVRRQNRNQNQNGAVETMIADTAGNGAQSGLPTAGDDGSITMTFYSVGPSCSSPVLPLLHHGNSEKTDQVTRSTLTVVGLSSPPSIPHQVALMHPPSKTPRSPMMSMASWALAVSRYEEPSNAITRRDLTCFPR